MLVATKTTISLETSNHLRFGQPKSSANHRRRRRKSTISSQAKVNQLTGKISLVLQKAKLEDEFPLPSRIAWLKVKQSTSSFD